MVHLPKGKLGRLTATQLNEMMQKLESGADFGEAQTPIGTPLRPRPTNFPIFAKLGDVIDESDKEDPNKGGGKGGDDDDGGSGDGTRWTPIYGGYEWTEVSFNFENRVWDTALDPRRYKSTLRNAAYAIGQDYQKGSMPNYTDKFAMLFPANDKNGNAMLVFEPPKTSGTPSSGMRTAQIVSSPGSACALTTDRKYIVAFTDVTDFDVLGNPIFTSTGLEVEAVNLIEYTGGTLGGSVTGTDASCPVELNPTPIPAGTNVMVSKIADATADSFAMYGFALPNDLCVECCGDGLAASLPQEIPVVRTPNNILSAMLVD